MRYKEMMRLFSVRLPTVRVRSPTRVQFHNSGRPPGEKQWFKTNRPRASTNTFHFGKAAKLRSCGTVVWAGAREAHRRQPPPRLWPPARPGKLMVSGFGACDESAARRSGPAARPEGD